MSSTTDAAVAAMLAEHGIDSPPARVAEDEAVEYGDAIISERLVKEALSGRWLWTEAMGWLRWNGVVWERCSTAALIETVRAWCVALVHSVALSGNDRALRVAAGLLGGHRIKRLVELCQGQEPVLREAEAFDGPALRHLLVCTNGVVDLRSGELLPHDPSRLVTKCTAVAYHPGAKSAAWDKALEAIPTDVRAWLALRFGQACTGFVPDDDRLCLLHGDGENGKSTVLGVVLLVLGSYGGLVPDKILLGSPGDHSTELMTLRGIRLAVIEETPESRRLSVARLKKVLGTATITAREVYRNNTTFTVTHSLFVSSNYLPVVEETDHGTWRRLCVARFPWTFVKPGIEPGPGQKPGDPTLKPRLEQPEAQEAALAWLVEGAKAWFAASRTMPSLPGRVEADTLAWRSESDSVLGYITERLVPDSRGIVAAADLLADLNAWLAARGQREWSDRTVGARFGSHEWAVRHGVARVRARSREGLSRPTGRTGLLSGERYQAWAGVRFRTASDDLAEGGGQGGQGQSELSKTRARREVSNDPDHPDQDTTLGLPA